MNVASILTKTYRITNTNSTTLLDGNSSNVLADLNTCYGHRTLDILGVRQDLNQSIKEVYTNLIATAGLVAEDVGYNGEYPFEADTLRPVRLEVSYDGVTWIPCDIYDINENRSSEFVQLELNNAFSKSSPMVRFERDSYFIRPLNDGTTVTNGIHIWTEKRQDDLTTGEPEFEANLHDILAYDLATLEVLMHPALYTTEWRNDFYAEKGSGEKRFNEFFKNRFKKTMQMRAKAENYR